MSRVENLKKSRDSLAVKFMQFTRIASKNRVAVFFEGEDEKYYSIRINTLRPDILWSGVNCKGKSNVVEIRNRIRQHDTYKDELCLFFVDSDFDDNQGIYGLSDVYLTPCYSIENLYFSEATFKRILSAEFGINDTCDESNCFHECMSKYTEMKSQYLKIIEGFNLLVKELRLMEKSGELDGRLNINNLNIDDLVTINLSTVSKKYDESSPKSLFPELPENIRISLEGSKAFFMDKNNELWYRGKQHLEFLRVLVSKLKEDRCRKNGREIFENRGNVTLQLTKANSISELGNYADTPECLRSFLENFKVGKEAA